MKSSMIMTVAAVLFVAAFAGIVVTDDVDAESVDLTYSYVNDGGQTVSYSESVDDSAPVTLKEFSEVFPGVDDTYFIGWSINSSTMVAGQPATIDGPTTAVAVFQTYTLTFEKSETPDITLAGDYNVSKTPGSIVKLPELTSEDSEAITDGYQFIGWTINGVLYAPGDEYTLSANATAVATYNDGFIVTLIDGSASYKVTILNGEVTDGTIPTISREGYVFDGWFDSEGIMAISADKIVSETYNFTDDVELQAEYTAITLPVEYVVNGEVVHNTVVEYGKTAVDKALPDGYGAWGVEVTAEDGTTSIVAYDFSTVVTSALKLVAIASEVPEPVLEVTFNIEGQYYTYEITDRFTIPNTDREGYEFTGWIVQGGDGTRLSNADVYAYEYTSDVTFVATYQAVEPPAPEEPGFFETTQGKTVAVIVVFVIVLFIAAVYLNLWGLRSKLFGWKIERKGKE